MNNIEKVINSKLKNKIVDFCVKISENIWKVESLELVEYHCSDINAIVHKIASIVITTISSTSVKAFLL